MPRPPLSIAAAFGDVVREQRQALEWSQLQLAERAGLTQAYISGIETGRRNPSIEVQARLADALGVAHDKLIARAHRRQRGEWAPRADGPERGR